MEIHWKFIAMCLAACLLLILALKTGTLVFDVAFTRDNRPGPQHRPTPRCGSRFRSALFAVLCVAASMFAAIAMRRFVDIRRDFQVNLSPAIESPLLVEDVDQLADRILKRDDASAELIPVGIPSETTEDQALAERQLAAVNATESALNAEALKVTLFDPGDANGRQAAALPDWTSQIGEADGVPRVIKTTPFPTVAGAQAEALTLLGRELAKTFIAQHPEAAGWTPSSDFVEEIGVVGRRAIAESTVQVGAFAEPVFTEYVEVLRPENLDALLFNAWRADTVNSRLLLVGGGMGILALLFASLAAYFRIDDATRGKYRRQLRVGTAALWVAAGSALALVA